MLNLFPKVLDVSDLGVGNAFWLLYASFLLAEIVIDEGNSVVGLLFDQLCN